MGIRWRLTLWFALLVAGILLLSGLVSHLLLQNYLSQEIDDNLRVYSAKVHGTLDPLEVPQPVDFHVIHGNLPQLNEFTSPGLYLQIMGSDGTIAVKSQSLGDRELPVDPLLVGKGFKGLAGIGTVAAGDGARIRMMVSPLYLSNETLLLEVGQSLQSYDATMRWLRLALFGGVFAALALTTVLGWAVVRRALSPVKQMTGIARAIEAGPDLSRRVDYHGPADEIRELASTFDSMLGKLDRAFHLQKRFVEDASHELRTPLTVIQGNLDLLNLGLNGEDRDECLRAMRAEAARMRRIVDDLLVLAEIAGGQVNRQESVNLGEVLLDGLERGHRLANGRKIVLGRHEPVVVKGDAHKLKQALGNLVDNAVKYTPAEGTVTLSLIRDGEWARIEVRDTGAGIAVGHLPHLFERFYRVDKARSRAGGGTGLGLAIVKEIAESLGGRVSVASENGKGSTFTMWLRT